MRTTILILLSIFSTTTFSQKLVVTLPDSLKSMNIKLNKVIATIDSLEKQHKEFEYQKNYFTQALESQQKGYSDDISVVLTFITIIVGFIGLFSYGGVVIKLRSIKNEFVVELKKANKILSTQYEETKKEQEIIKLELYEEKGNVYTTHMNIISDTGEKFVYAIRASNEYILAKLNNTALLRIIYAKNLFATLIKEKFKISNHNNEIVFGYLSNILKLVEMDEVTENGNKDQIKIITQEIISGLSQIKNSGVAL